MKCAWKELMSILPSQIVRQVDEQGRNGMQELRLRIGHAPEMILHGQSVHLNGLVEEKDLNFIVNIASKYSPWTAQTVTQGYITAPGGHRIGLCGDAVVENSQMKGIRHLTSLCIRVARDFPGIASNVDFLGSLLLIGGPGCGKTTMLRDIIRQLSNRGNGSIGVVDERGELFPNGCFDTGPRTDVLSGCSKPYGIDIMLRTMSPSVIAMDEITREEDCAALIRSAWCGVRLIATAHASDIYDLLNRPVYQPLVRSHLFSKILILRQDKSWKMERMENYA